MTVAGSKPEAAPASEPTSAAPNWNMVPFDVGCARCGHDLRGLSEPRCPACGLEFDWADAVPIEQLTCRRCDYHLCGLQETRCPECGEPFTWEEALAVYHRQKHPLFEYHWYDRPISSLMSTWFRALRPGKLWKQIDIHDPPQTMPLVFMVLLAFVALILSVSLSGTLSNWLCRQLWASRYGWTRVGISRLPGDIRYAISDPDVHICLGVVLIWFLASLASLMIFRQSMKRYRVRTAQVVRVWAHAVPLMVPLVPVFLGTCMVGDELARWWLQVPGLEEDTVLCVLLLALLCHVMWSLAQGYKHYLKMRRSVAVAIASQMTAVLGTLVLGSVVTNDWTLDFLRRFLDLLLGRG